MAGRGNLFVDTTRSDVVIVVARPIRCNRVPCGSRKTRVEVNIRGGRTTGIEYAHQDLGIGADIRGDTVTLDDDLTDAMSAGCLGETQRGKKGEEKKEEGEAFQLKSVAQRPCVLSIDSDKFWSLKRRKKSGVCRDCLNEEEHF
ncbi:MAG: hypothetical protein BGO25_02615 [Acidobacteriales bacterium 59-55]|nr:MAG: hypothetical protein BGO25_02615 [Acidobacteriales bacterium 59-55]